MAKINCVCPICQKVFVHREFPSTKPLKLQPCCSPTCSATLQGGKPSQNVWDRFWSKVDIRSINECWEWKDYVRPDGYARFRIGDRMVLAHRISYALVFGEIPGDLKICHKCDNRKCQNWHHYFLGTQLDNMIDRDAKNRGRKGKVYPLIKGNKLTIEMVRQIKDLYKTGNYNQPTIANMFSISTTTVCNIVNGKAWKQVA